MTKQEIIDDYETKITKLSMKLDLLAINLSEAQHKFADSFQKASWEIRDIQKDLVKNFGDLK